ncbi:DUF3419 family protein [Fundidesulfovibrio butyratiphilus]
MSQVSSGLLKSAVRRSPAFSSRGVLEGLFCSWFSGMVYNQIWEDPRVDVEAMALGPGHRVLTIASGGCNILHYLMADPEEVAAVDLNHHHLHLSRLKVAAVRRLPSHDQFFRFFGQADQPANLEAYENAIRPSLPHDTRAYWDARPVPGAARRISLFSRGLYDHARMGSFLRLLSGLCRLLGKDPARLLAATSLREQREIYRSEIEPLLLHPVVRLLSRFSFSVFSLGIPPSQFEALKRECAGSVAEDLRARVERLATAFPVRDNPYAWQAFSRRYDVKNRHGVPDYLHKDNFCGIKQRANRVSLTLTSLDAFLDSRPDASLDRYVLLDSQDWMSPAAVAGLWEKIVRTARPGARVIFRTAGAASPVETALPKDLRRAFLYEKALSRALHARDRSGIYGGFHLYRLAR